MCKLSGSHAEAMDGRKQQVRHYCCSLLDNGLLRRLPCICIRIRICICIRLHGLGGKRRPVEVWEWELWPADLGLWHRNRRQMTSGQRGRRLKGSSHSNGMDSVSAQSGIQGIPALGSLGRKIGSAPVTANPSAVNVNDKTFSLEQAGGDNGIIKALVSISARMGHIFGAICFN